MNFRDIGKHTHTRVERQTDKQEEVDSVLYSEIAINMILRPKYRHYDHYREGCFEEGTRSKEQGDNGEINDASYANRGVKSQYTRRQM